jgi:uncharacterized membrane protein (UPF0127 family)
MASFLTPLLDDAAGFELRNGRTGGIVASSLLTAFDSKSRRTGLLKHAGLDGREALIIAPSNAIHTWFMRFPIDVAFVTRDGKIVKICECLGPWRMAFGWKGFAVIEFAGGALTRSGTRVGDRLTVVRRDQPAVAAATGSGPEVAS